MILNQKLEEQRTKREKTVLRKETSSLTNENLSRNNSGSRIMHTVPTESNINDHSFSYVLNTNPSMHAPSISMLDEYKLSQNRTKGIISFEKYSSRKDIFKTSVTETDVLTYLEPNDLLKENK
jgi:hypothetical protein